jgi:hypothetical protein
LQTRPTAVAGVHVVGPRGRRRRGNDGVDTGSATGTEMIDLTAVKTENRVPSCKLRFVIFYPFD